MDHWRKNSTNNSRRLSHCFGLSNNSTEDVERTKQSSLYVEKFRNMRLITSTNVRQRRQLAIPGQHSIHYYRPRKELSPFSAYFLRVCACMILHTTGFTAIQILFKLCWRPLAFCHAIYTTLWLVWQSRLCVLCRSLRPNASSPHTFYNYNPPTTSYSH